MYKQLSFVIMAAIMLTAIVTIATYSESAHAAIICSENNCTNMKNATTGGSVICSENNCTNMKNATTGGSVICSENNCTNIKK
jgi:hypothetical protein